MKSFNTAGPCIPGLHYMLPPEPRLPDARRLIDGGYYFAVHAPRQTGKTTTLAQLARNLTAEGSYTAVRFSCERSEPAGEDYMAAQRGLLDALRDSAKSQGLPAELMPPDPWPEAAPESLMTAALAEWSEHSPRPLVLFFDEIDALRGESLRSVLRQLRDGYTRRPTPFPHSVVLCGLRDVRDYKAASGGDPTRLGTSSPFNIKVKSLRLGDFTREDVYSLYQQHTDETGQVFTPDGLERAWAYSQGQPWLTNALAREVIEEIDVEAAVPITADHLDEAKERLVLARATHLDSLAAKLHEPQVVRVIQPLLAGALPETNNSYDDNVAYVRDLGLITPKPPVAVANPIYREVIARVLSARTEDVVTADPRSFVLPDGRLDFPKLLEEFACFWQEHGDVLASRGTYHEPAAQLVIMAFFQRLVNGGGYIDREYGIGRGRIDLLIRWPYTDPQGKQVRQREAIELKVWRPGERDPLERGLRQLDDYLDRLGLDQGTLVIFDRRPDAPDVTERTTFSETHTPAGRAVTLLRA